ncbi:MAG: 1-acyl-sn-glycerol-3-phosphate acyltransferase [Paludibacteraceae bacterium]|nr:1-acyl-sn-glycerol-3-phosphate acyltransferase [Paludibacteraceae bacterium]
MNIPSEFDEIRPYSPEELPAVFEELIADEQFKQVVGMVYKDVPFEALAAKMRQCRTNLEFQKTFFYGMLHDLANKCGKGMTMDASSLTRKNDHHYTFISNHRDIVLDSAFLSAIMIDNGFNSTVEIAIGDNLLIYPWIKKLVRINKSFIVQRSLSMRQMLESSLRMSRYMHFVINEKKENIWIAQREGRAKDSDDRTQDSILKMMAMGGEGSIIDRLKQLNIVPLAISYEYDPCDYLKAKEFQQKRDIEGFKKSPADDLINMQTGIFGYKGYIHFQTAPRINSWLDMIDENMPKQEMFTLIAQHIDHEIHRNYRLYPCNYIASDMLSSTSNYGEAYSKEQAEKFEAYVKGQVAKVDLENKDEEFLTKMILTMYANPLKNYIKAIEEKR